MWPPLYSRAHAPRPVFGPGGRLSPFREPFEFYPTPPEATRALLSVERFDGAIWEPACGQGHIAKVLEAHGADVVATDLVDHGYGRPGVDFLDQRLPRAKHIVTNPPYGRGLGDAFVRKALTFTQHTGGRVAMLLNIASLCHPDRHDSFVRRPPSVIYALDQCVCLPGGDARRATRRTYEHRYVWLVWEPETIATPTTAFRWLTTAPFTDVAIAKRNAQAKRRSS
jgi:predicted RNA methylase